MNEQKHDHIFLHTVTSDEARIYGHQVWTFSRIHEDDVEYIRADLVAEQIAAKNSEIDLLTKQFTDMSDSVSIQRYNNDINELREELATKDALLKKLEWSKSYSYCTGWPSCPICRGIKPGYGRDEDGTLPDNQGHKKGCGLASAIDKELGK